MTNQSGTSVDVTTLPGLRLAHLQSFLAVAEHLHFGRAAASTHLAQPALSRHIAALERALGAQLFHRTTRLVALTEAGEVLADEAQSILLRVSEAVARVRDTDAGFAGTLRIGLVASAALSVVPQIATELRELGAAVQLRYSDLTTDAQIDELRRGTIDLGVMREVRSARGLTIVPLGRERLVAAVPASHELASRENIALSDLANEPFVVSPRTRVPRLYDHIAALCHSAGFTLEVRQEALQFTTILGLVSSGAGVSVVPEPLASLGHPGLAFVPLTDSGAFSQVSLAYVDEEPLNPLVTRSVEMLRGAFAT